MDKERNDFLKKVLPNFLKKLDKLKKVASGEKFVHPDEVFFAESISPKLSDNIEIAQKVYDEAKKFLNFTKEIKETYDARKEFFKDRWWEKDNVSFSSSAQKAFEDFNSVQPVEDLLWKRFKDDV